MGGAQVDLAQDKPASDVLLEHVMVTLHLIPVGCKLYNMTMPQLRQLIRCILTAPMVIHAAVFQILCIGMCERTT